MNTQEVNVQCFTIYRTLLTCTRNSWHVQLQTAKLNYTFDIGYKSGNLLIMEMWVKQSHSIGYHVIFTGAPLLKDLQ